jgi:hypothetical protein
MGRDGEGLTTSWMGWKKERRRAGQLPAHVTFPHARSHTHTDAHTLARSGLSGAITGNTARNSGGLVGWLVGWLVRLAACLRAHAVGEEGDLLMIALQQFRG